LELDRAVVSREIFFSATSIFFLWYVLHDIAPIDGDDEEHLYISFVDACLLVSGYVMYVVACINYDSIVTLLSCTVPGSDPAVVRLPQMVRSPMLDHRCSATHFEAAALNCLIADNKNSRVSTHSVITSVPLTANHLAQLEYLILLQTLRTLLR
jgi:hypothetical protein